MARTMAAGRVLANRRTAWLVVGDLVVIGIFVAVGVLRHNGGVSDWAITFGEFSLAWLVVATSFGTYSPAGSGSRSQSVGRTVGSWLIAAPVGVALRAWVEPLATFSPVFLLVMVGTGLVFLVPWRAVVAPRVIQP